MNNVFRHLSMGLALLIASAAGANTAAGLGAGQQWNFDVFLDEKPIGEHTFAVANIGNQLTLQSNAQFKVKFLFFTAYAYEHEATEQWAGNCLTGLEATTDDNGTQYALSGGIADETFIISNGETQTALSACIMTFAYWNPAILDQTQLLNVQTGDYESVRVSYQGTDRVPVAGELAPARRYLLQTDELQITLWYDESNSDWLSLESQTADGYTLRYQLRGLNASSNVSAKG